MAVWLLVLLLLLLALVVVAQAWAPRPIPTHMPTHSHMRMRTRAQVSPSLLPLPLPLLSPSQHRPPPCPRWVGAVRCTQPCPRALAAPVVVAAWVAAAAASWATDGCGSAVPPPCWHPCVCTLHRGPSRPQMSPPLLPGAVPPMAHCPRACPCTAPLQPRASCGQGGAQPRLVVVRWLDAGVEVEGEVGEE